MFYKSPSTGIPFDCLDSWQKLLDTVSNLFNRPICLIFRKIYDELEILASNQNSIDSSLINKKFKLVENHFFSNALSQKDGILISSKEQGGLCNEESGYFADIQTFLGITLNMPNDNIFGLFCIMDYAAGIVGDMEIEVLQQFKGTIERDFKIIRQNEIINHEIDKRKEIESELRALNEELKAGLEQKFTEIDKISKNLKAIEDDYQLIVENQNALVVKFDKDYRLTYISPQYARELGTNSQELEEQSFFPYIHPEDLESVKNSLKNLTKPPYTCSHEERLKTIKGWRWYFWSNKSVIDKNGEIVGVVAVGRDIQAQKQSEFALKESEERYALAMKGATDGLWDQNLVTGEIYFSERWKSMLGYGNDELKNSTKSFEQLLHDEDIERVRIHKREYLAGKIPKYEIEFRMLHKDGCWLNIFSRGFKVLDDNKQAVRLVGTHLDITNLRKAENALKKSEEGFRKIIELNSIAMVVTNNNQDLIIANKAFEKTFGYSIDEVSTAEKWREKAYPDPEYRNIVSSQWTKAIVDAIRTGTEIKSQIWEPVCKDGTKKIIEFSFVPLGEQNIITMVDLTELKKTEQALIESEEKNRAFSEATDEALFFCDKGICIDCNKAAYKMFGYDDGELIGIRDIEIIADESQELVKKNMNSLYGEPYEALVITKKGEKFWAELHGRMYCYKGKNVRVTAVRNISKRKRAEEELVYSEEKFRAAFKTSPDSVNINRLSDGVYVEINDGFTWLTGYTKEDVIGKTSVEIDIWANSKDRQKLVDVLLEKGYYANLEADFRIKDGQLITALLSARIIKLGGEKYILSMTRDIRPLKQVQNELIKAKELAELREKEYKQLFNEMLDGFAIHQVIYDENGVPVDYRFIDINPAYEKFTGLRWEQVKNKSVKEIIPNIEQHWIDNFGKVGKTGEPFWFEDYIEEFDRHYNGLAYSSQKDYFAVIISDVTDEKRAEKLLLDNDKILKEQNEEYLSLNEELTSLNIELMEAKEKAIESDNLKTAFLANMSHEIRTPMNGIMGFTGLLAKEGLEQEKKQRYIEIIHQNSNQLLSIINDLVDISKIEAGQIELEHNEVRLDTVMLSLVELYQQKADDKEILFELANNSSGLEIIVDETKLRQILINLLDNAFKFTAEGKIRFGYQLSDNTIEFFVSDTGIGIERKAHNIIFERFRQVELTSARKYGGTGLGLSISKAYVLKMGGKIWLESELGKGTRFYFTIPFKPVLKPIEKNDQDSIDISAIDWSTYTILIAEDEMVNYKFLEEILEETRVNILWALNGKEAVEMCLDNDRINLVLMDIKMPIINGYDATRAIKKLKPNLPIIAQTAYALIGDESKVRGAGCDDYIHKPINISDLLAKIAKFLN